ncbi:DUF2141 domain-containing protein [Sphingomonas sp. AP4-R1]|uniref:DUF2141 domain-containing protein n=1 Tax=Sphingomonas sp. AP4-R1 TaxID=2735134 RepID=UPI0014933211|nr:DUF2141 domain-containing protein [Sphingomonas sp. AP4-R1]QJU57521.1 DUF2141 domain-containing protein [Sphingomonas sp. AP4-R1]
MAIAVALMLAAAAGTGTLTIDVGNVRSNKGKVHLDVCPQSLFLKDGCPYSTETPAHEGQVTLTIENLPPGHYAIQAFHDENDNRHVDRGLFGIPTEGVGFSRDARIVLSPPKWDDAVFDFDGKATQTALKMRYFTGRKGPPAR